MKQQQTVQGLQAVIAVARGAVAADLLLRDARIVNVFNGDITRTNVAVKNGVIAGIGDYTVALEIIDLAGQYLLPGLIDGHIHIESSMLTPPAFAAAAVPHGTTAVVADPHEIANVAGLAGLRYMVEASAGLPLDFFYTIPSCVPASPLETAGAALGPAEVAQAFALLSSSPALAEMMNYPGVLAGEPALLEKINGARAAGRQVDGHAPLLSGRDLNAYIAAGITTDHENSMAQEAREKLRLGMTVLIREGSAAKNLLALLPLVNEHTWPSIAFCSDDRHPGDLLAEGGIDHILRRAVAAGLAPLRAVQLATINTARHYNLKGRGAIAPGYLADLVVVDNLENFGVEMVFKEGRLVARAGKLLDNIPASKPAEVLQKSVHLPELRGRLALPEPPATGARARVITVQQGQLLTGMQFLTAAEIDSAEDLARVAVVERHGISGNVATGLVRGFGPLRGALASTVAHDSHNLIILGSDAAEMEAAARAVAAQGGGLAVVAAGGEERAVLPLPVAGLMSDAGAASVARRHALLCDAAREIGCTLPHPFMALSFLSLPVIPELKITDRGLVDVNRFTLVDLWT
ncbi:MAG: adenine deaminase [Bacillota bacterium]